MSFIRDAYGEINKWIVGAIAAVVLLPALMFGMPVYSVWEQGMTGRAELARAEQNRQIARFEAQAELARAEGAAQAEVARAHGNAEANAIIADGLGGPEGYLRYLYIQALKDSETEVIYVPTEAGLPVLEAGHRNRE